MQQSNVSTTQPKTRALASSAADARAEPPVAGALGTVVAAFNANDLTQHGLATTQVNELAPPSICKAIAACVLEVIFSLCCQMSFATSGDALHSDWRYHM